MAFWTSEDWLVYALFSSEPKIDQPVMLYRLMDGARGERGVSVAESQLVVNSGQ